MSAPLASGQALRMGNILIEAGDGEQERFRIL
jgi:hypothetical protein